VNVIELKADSTAITALDLAGVCAGHAQLDTQAAQSTLSGGVTLDATALTATILGVPVTITAAGLPAGPLNMSQFGVSLPALPTNLGILTVTLKVLSVTAPSQAASQLAVSVAGC
jgi:hypothetical protein